jgi:parallel beta-helix repeat protein
LTNPEIYNVVTIEKGVYWVDSHTSITIDDNTNVVLEGTIRMKPNARIAYDVILVKGQNVVISGKGEIVGDRDEHLGEKGEWGMGINLNGAKNVVINGITISNCWGDGIYVYGDSENVLICDCSLTKCRRQGISVTEAKNVSIQRCVMSGIGGTSPGLGIDIEPHKGKAVDNVYISDVIVRDSEGGISASNRAKGSAVGEITIRNSSFYGTKKDYCLHLSGSPRVVIDNCYIESGNSTALVLANIGTAVCLGNTIVSSSSRVIRKSKCLFVQDIDNSIKKNR